MELWIALGTLVVGIAAGSRIITQADERATREERLQSVLSSYTLRPGELELEVFRATNGARLSDTGEHRGKSVFICFICVPIPSV